MGMADDPTPGPAPAAAIGPEPTPAGELPPPPARPPVHVTTWDDGAGPAAPRVVLVHGTLSWGTRSYAQQRPLAARFRLQVLDRRGYGRSPDTGRSDYAADARDIAELLDAEPGGAHLVGHSYGGVAAMYAAALRPHAVRSLALIEPSPLRAAEDHPVVAAALARIRAAFGAVPAQMSPEEYLAASTEPYGLPVPEPTPDMLRATRTAMRERPCWDAADVPLPALAAAPYPKLVLNGTWETAHPDYRAFNGEALAACGATVAARIGARHLRVEGSDHNPHLDRPAPVNALLAEVWATA
jgi:pimeloyl-ACP methyl ester carboxylesterase